MPFTPSQTIIIAVVFLGIGYLALGVACNLQSECTAPIVPTYLDGI